MTYVWTPSPGAGKRAGRKNAKRHAAEQEARRKERERRAAAAREHEEIARQRREQAKAEDRTSVRGDNNPITDAERAYWNARTCDDGMLELWGTVLRIALQDGDEKAVKAIAPALGLDADALLKGAGYPRRHRYRT